MSFSKPYRGDSSTIPQDKRVCAPQGSGTRRRGAPGAGRTNRIPFAPLRVGKCWNADSRNEIDVVATGGDGVLLLGECKWGMVRPCDLETLQARPIQSRGS
ncbi:MAG TPA: DUF234 domain-containing protein [Longimicrobiaceae bacterium]|nr:DUF234 domain-containing protein [Longimicrobiaceae bacterium]